MKDQDSSQTSLLQEWIQDNDAHLNDVIHHSDKGLIPLLRRSFFLRSNKHQKSRLSQSSSGFRSWSFLLTHIT